MGTLTSLKPARAIFHAVPKTITVDESPASSDVVHAAVPAKTQVFQDEFAYLPDPRNYSEAKEQ